MPVLSSTPDASEECPQLHCFTQAWCTMQHSSPTYSFYGQSITRQCKPHASLQQVCAALVTHNPLGTMLQCTAWGRLQSSTGWFARPGVPHHTTDLYSNTFALLSCLSSHWQPLWIVAIHHVWVQQQPATQAQGSCADVLLLITHGAN